MTIELTQKQIQFLLEMINILNFPGREAEAIYEIKQKIVVALKESEVEEKT